MQKPWLPGWGFPFGHNLVAVLTRAAGGHRLVPGCIPCRIPGSGSHRIVLSRRYIATDPTASQRRVTLITLDLNVLQTRVYQTNESN